MQEEVENRTLTLVVNGTKFSGRMLKSAIGKYLAHRAEAKRQKARDGPVTPHGKQTVKQLIGQGQGVNNIEVNDPSLRDFERIARKYGVDYAIKKGVSPEGKQRYMLFFKARDRSAIDQAMSAYAASDVKKHKREHPPIEQVVDPLKEMLPGRKKDRVRDKGMQR